MTLRSLDAQFQKGSRRREACSYNKFAEKCIDIRIQLFRDSPRGEVSDPSGSISHIAINNALLCGEPSLPLPLFFLTLNLNA